MKTTEFKKYWRSIDELENSAEFQELLHREFPVAASEFPSGLSRRRWLQLMGASLTLASVAGCRWETEKIAPFASRPEGRIPGEPQRYATSIELAGALRHLLVTCYDGRPVKVEGNPEHPASRGASDTFSQAATLGLYDPDRSDTVRQRVSGRTFNKNWSDFEAFTSALRSRLAENRGAGFGMLIEPTSSATIGNLLKRFAETYPETTFYEYASVSRDQELAGSEFAFGRRLRTHFDLSKADVIACFDADLLGTHPTAIKHARDFSAGRDPDAGVMNRMYAVESQFSITGAAADHRLPMKSSRVGICLAALDAEIRAKLGDASAGDVDTLNLDDDTNNFLHSLAGDLVAARGRSFVAVGPRQPANIHALAHRINARLQNIGATVRFTNEPEPAMPRSDLKSLVDHLNAGEVKTLLILGGNPVYSAPVGLDFTAALATAETSIHLSPYDDETSRRCQWHLPQTHPFESWCDLRAFDGTIGIGQPLIAPLLDGRSEVDLLAMFCGEVLPDERQLVRDSVSKASGKPLSDKDWRRLVHDGFLPGSRLPEIQPELVDAAVPTANTAASPASENLELVFTPSSSTYDGRFANNGWLQETPDFLTKLTWDNAAIFNPTTAKQLGVEHGTIVELNVDGRSVEVAVFVLPGQARNSIGLALGYGRTAAGHVGGDSAEGIESVGVNANLIRTWAHQDIATNVDVAATVHKYPLATTQDHHAIDTVGLEETGRRVGELVRETSLDDFVQHPEFAHDHGHHAESLPLWDEHSYDGHAWGMAIDLTKCIGCNACMVACQAENNVPVVGKDQVAVGREMHWIRVDRYFRGDVDNPQIATQPVACHHCENAPCEQVCPVAATVHSDEGLNDMIYNRCIGTRYCANNCPYKVRRFNFFDYNKPLEEPGRELVQLVTNPEVTVRSRGVMEKCSYCVQRIQGAKIDAKNGGRPVRDGEIKTACQQACPTQAIEFGDLNQKDSRVAKAHANNRAYGMLAELNVKPRTKYLARIRNPHPDLAVNRVNSLGHGGHKA